MPDFQVVSKYSPQGDQPQAIDKLVAGVHEGKKFQTLMGVTGSGKTFSMAHTVARLNRPTLVISHNKTLAAQLYEEFKELFPHNAVGYFVSYYDYYQPEAYIPQRDIYIEKDASRNDDLDRLRLSATSNLVSRRDVLIVASVSCIFGLGSPESYQKSVLPIRKDVETDRDDMLKRLIELQYSRNDMDFKRATFRVRGDVVELQPSYEEFAYRIEFFGDEITNIDSINPLTGEILGNHESIFIYPAVHYVMPEDKVESAIQAIKNELEMRVIALKNDGKLLEAQRLMARTKYDLEMIQEVGYCGGIENYSRHLDGRQPGEKPSTLLDYFSDDYLLVIDESHVTLPQIKAMYNGDRQRKEVLVEHGFRLPSALDNRPLKFEEFEQMINQCVYVSATPGKLELERTGGEVIEQIIRPTGLIDPVIEIHPAQGQVPHLLASIKDRVASGERVLVTALTKRLSEDLAAYIQEAGLRGRYLHSEIQTLERVEILSDLRKGDFDVLIGVNLLREGLDLPEVSLVAILDADKAGFLRSETSLIQTIGRAARNVNAKVLLYADSVTPAMQNAIDETTRRRVVQLKYNADHGITPQTVKKAIRTSLESEMKARKTARDAIHADEGGFDQTEILRLLEEEMLDAARNLEFERAAQLRDKINEIKGAPTISGDALAPTEAEERQSKIWQPKNKGKGKRNKTAK
ncbi:excinuclease ABC subunit UvrB [Humisphaera borealis]|uniref:UvrABC system protein B n=1 Tax=Humisphaera borealis TaxID=2807512 RepID=A0A7M2WRZ7_9BACT|nr:excinuclease ABC subunit UvrB [Humisphaera borealis]QOV88315.1 excinuclease ABC subunit UvrB [Humisphaera borealis]